VSVAQSRQQTHTAQFTARWGPSGTVITAAGELDAANSDELAAYVQRGVSRSKRVIVDLRGLKFIGTAGFSALHRINVVCSTARAQWAVAPSAAVSRLLRVCDPDGTLPIMTVAAEPLLESAKWAEKWTENDELEALLQLVTESR
jgi:anti-anti-sigma factor